MLELLQKIHEEQTKLEKESTMISPKVAFYREFFRKYPTRNIIDIINIPSQELILAVLASSNATLSFEFIEDAVRSNGQFLEEINMEAFDAFIKAAITQDEEGNFDAIVEALQQPEEEISISDALGQLFDLFKAMKEKNVASNTTLMTKFFIGLAEEHGTTKENLAKLLYIIKQEAKECKKYTPEYLEVACREDLGILLSHAVDLRDTLDIYRDHYKHIEEYTKEADQASGRRTSKKVRDQMYIDFVSTFSGNYKETLASIARISKYFERISSLEQNRVTGLRREKGNLEQLATIVGNALKAPTQEVTLPTKVISKISSPELKRQVLTAVYIHNKDIQLGRLNEYLELSANDATHYRLLLSQYGITPDKYDVSTVMDISLSDLEAMLKTLTKLKITDPEQLVFLLQTSDIASVSAIHQLAERGVLSYDFVALHPRLFSIDSKEQSALLANLATIQDEKLNPYHFTTSEDRLLISPAKFSETISILSEYQLTQCLKTGLDLSFLGQDGLPEAIDTLLELGYEESLEENLSLLNYKDRFNRLRVLKELNIPVTKEELIQVLSNDKFYVPDHMISDYLYNATEHNLPAVITSDVEQEIDLSCLDEFSNTSRTYLINGVLISKSKVRRNLQDVTKTIPENGVLLYGICKGSVLTDEEYQRISSQISGEKASSPIIKKI